MKPRSILGARLRSSLTHAFLIAALVLGLAGTALADTATLCTGAADYTSGASALIDVDPAGGPRSSQVDILPTSISDLIMRSYGEYFYRIERYKSDSIAKFHISDPTTPLWQYSTLDSADQVSNNPHDLIFVNASKAYMPMYGSSGIWIVNLNAAAEAEFKTGTLDISSYQDSDGIPEAHEGIVVNGKLFVLIQRLDRNSSWWPTNNSYVAVFDIATDTEIDTGKGAADGVKGITLPVKSPNAVVYVPELNKIFISAAGRYPYGTTTGYEYTGGLVSIDVDTYEVATVVEDGDADNHPYGAMGSLQIISPILGYFVGYHGTDDTTIHAFNPSTGEVGGTIGAMDNKNCTVSTSGGLGVDKNGLLWITDRTDAQVLIYNTTSGAVDEAVSTNLNPLTISFCADPGALDAWVATLFIQIMDREATAGELTQIVAALRDGSFTATSGISMLINGSIFQARNTTDEQYVNILFQVFYGAGASADQLAAYLAYLSGEGTRSALLSSFINNVTFWRKCEVMGVPVY